jgi:hypothetical protein
MNEIDEFAGAVAEATVGTRSVRATRAMTSRRADLMGRSYRQSGLATSYALGNFEISGSPLET